MAGRRPVPCIISYAEVSSDETFLKTIPDRNRFLEKLGLVLQKTSTPCYGWALIPNHLLLKTGKEAVAQIMLRLLTGYAVTFNRRHRRYGRLFLSEALALRAGGKIATPLK